MNNPLMLPPKTTRRIVGSFRMRNPVLARTRVGRTYMRTTLEDMNGSLPAYAWQEELFRDLSIFDMSRVHVEGQLRWHAGRQIIDVSYIDDSMQNRLTDAVQLIPQSVCPLPKLMPYLQSAVNQINIRPLSAFVQSVLSDDSVAFAFVLAPASINHHHNYPGGLLMHSLECFQMVERHKEFPYREFQIGLVAALFHDIGKVLTLTHEMKRTSLGCSIDHDKLTFEILAPHLEKLDEDLADVGRELRYLLSWKLKRRIPKYNMADLVTCYDRVSTGLDMGRRRHGKRETTACRRF